MIQIPNEFPLIVLEGKLATPCVVHVMYALYAFNTGAVCIGTRFKSKITYYVITNNDQRVVSGVYESFQFY